MAQARAAAKGRRCSRNGRRSPETHTPLQTGSRSTAVTVAASPTAAGLDLGQAHTSQPAPRLTSLRVQARQGLLAHTGLGESPVAPGRAQVAQLLVQGL